MKAICPLCKGMIEQGQTTFTVDFGVGVIVVRDVPAQVCRLCGADWIDDDIADKLETFVNTAKQHHTMVEVTSWQATSPAFV